MKQIRQLLLKSRIQEALNGLLEHFKDDTDVRIQVEQLIIRLQHLEKDQLAGVLSASEYRTEQNKINRATLMLTYPKPSPISTSENWKKWTYLLVIGTILILSVLGGYNWINKMESKSGVQGEEDHIPNDNKPKIDTPTVHPVIKEEKETPIKLKLLDFSTSKYTISSDLKECLKNKGFKEGHTGKKIEFEYSGEIVNMKKSDLLQTFVYDGGKLIIKVDGIDIGDREFDLKRSDSAGGKKDSICNNIKKEIENLIKSKHKKVCEKIYNYVSK